MSANVSWFIKENNENIYSAKTNYYAGYCSSVEDLIIECQLWNNRWNTVENASDMTNAKMLISFSNIEDSILLNYCKVSVDGVTYISPTIELNRGTVMLGTILGIKNNGDLNNIYNYKNITITFTGLPNELKDGLKSMFLDIRYDEQGG